MHKSPPRLDEANISIFPELPVPLSRDVDAFWIEPGRAVEISGIRINDGMIYMGINLEAQRTSGCLEPSLVDPSLDVRELPSGKKAPTFSDFPYYRFLTPEQRYAYLQWLSHRNEFEEVDPNILRLYLFGLERRLVSDFYQTTLKSHDVEAIIQELKRLMHALENLHPEMAKRIAGLLDWASYVHFKNIASPKSSLVREHGSILFRYRFSMRAAQSSIDYKTAYEWVLFNNPELMPASLNEYAEYVDALFRIGFQQSFPDGVRLDEVDTPMHLSYKPISPGLPIMDVYLRNHRDPGWVSASYVRVRKLFSDVTKQISTLADAVRNLPGDPLYSVRFWASLPEPLQQELELQPQRGILCYFKSALESAGGFVTVRVRDLLSLVGGEQCAALDSHQIRSDDLVPLARLLQLDGIALEPDPGRFMYTYAAKDCIVAYRGGQAPLADQKAYVTATTLMLFINVLSECSPNGQFAELVDWFMAHIPGLRSQDRSMVTAHLTWLKGIEVANKHLQDRLSVLDSADKQAIQLLVYQFLEGLTVPDSVPRRLERIHTYLGKAKTTVPSLLSKYRVQVATDEANPSEL